MSEKAAHTDHSPVWWVIPDGTDWLAWGAIIAIGLAVYLVMYLYAKFDHWAEHKAKGTPLAKTIPTLLGVALLYEIFPLDHFNILLPLSAILIAVMADWMRHHSNPEPAVDVQVNTVEQADSMDIEAETEQVTNV